MAKGLVESGSMDTSIFGANSVRATTVSTASRMGITANEILYTYPEQQIGIQSWFSKTSITGHPRMSFMEDQEFLAIPRIVWRKLQTTQLMCETTTSQV